MERCISAIRCWMIKDKLKVNDSKTEFILIGTRQQLAKVDIKGLVVGDATISPVIAVKNLGSWFDENMNMGCHFTCITPDASESIYLKTPQKHSCMHSSPHVLIIAMVCCMVYQPHISTSCNVFRTVLPDLFVPFPVFVI